MLSKDKTSFVLYTSFYDAVKELPFDRKGMLLDLIFEYEMGSFDEGKFDGLPGDVKMAFRFIKGQLDKDKEKWRETCETRADAGRKGNQKRWGNRKSSQTIAKVASASFATREIANVADNEDEYEDDNDISDITNDITVSEKEKNKKEKVLSLVGAESENPPEPRQGNWNAYNEDVAIDADWYLDFDDPLFVPYAKIPDSIKVSVEKWIRREKIGTIISKRFIIEQFTNFARRQGKVKELLGCA